MSVGALDIRGKFFDSCAQMTERWSVSETAIVAVSNGPSANDLQHTVDQPKQSTPEINNSISGAYSILDNVNAVPEQLPGVQEGSAPIAVIKLDEITPPPPGGMTPMLCLGAIGDACETIKGMAVKEQEHTPVPFIQTPQREMEVTYTHTPPAGMCSPS